MAPRRSTPPQPPTPRTRTVCRLCGGAPREPKPRVLRGREVQCASPTFHPVTKRYRGQEVGNAAAAGEVLGVSGDQYQWLTRRPDGPGQAPGHIGFDATDGWKMYRMSEVRKFNAERPGRGARTDLTADGAGSTDDGATSDGAVVDNEPATSST